MYFIQRGNKEKDHFRIVNECVNNVSSKNQI